MRWAVWLGWGEHSAHTVVHLHNVKLNIAVDMSINVWEWGEYAMITWEDCDYRRGLTYSGNIGDKPTGLARDRAYALFLARSSLNFCTAIL